MRLSYPLLLLLPWSFLSACSADGEGITGGNATGGGAQIGTGGATSGTGAASTTDGTMSGGATLGAGGTQTTGGTASGGNSGGSGAASSGGSSSSGGASGGAASGGSGNDNGPVPLDCDASMPTSGAQPHSGNGRGGDDNLAWEIWSNTGMGELTTYDVPAFTATWNEAGGYLGRLGFEWGAYGDTPKPHEQHGTITAQYVANKTGTGGQYSYVGMYGWSDEPCVEWYVIDDSFNTMPVNPGTTTKTGEVDIDDGTYIMYTRPTEGSGGTRCSNATEWIQYYSIRKTPRRCGQISLTEHFNAWDDLNMPLGDLLEAKILVEVGGGSGSVEFPVARVMTTQ